MTDPHREKARAIADEYFRGAGDAEAAHVWLTDTIATALRDADEAGYVRGLAEAAKVICPRCAKGVPVQGREHWVNDGLQARGEPGRYVPCAAAAILAFRPAPRAKEEPGDG